MTVNVTSYTGLKSAVAAWMARAGDTLLEERFDDCLALHEHRMYYGAAAVPGLLPAFEPLRIRQMEVTDTAFALDGAPNLADARSTQSEEVRVTEDAADTVTLSGFVAQPTDFLELIEAFTNSPRGPMRIEHEGVIAAYGDQTLGGPRIIAVSGTNFRIKDTPGAGDTATLRYYQKLTTPAASATANWILANAPGVYLNGCLIEAALMTQDFDNAAKYGAIYAAQVAGLNERKNRELAHATNVRVRLRGRTP